MHDCGEARNPWGEAGRIQVAPQAAALQKALRLFKKPPPDRVEHGFRVVGCAEDLALPLALGLRGAMPYKPNLPGSWGRSHSQGREFHPKGVTHKAREDELAMSRYIRPGRLEVECESRFVGRQTCNVQFLLVIQLNGGASSSL